MVAIEDIQQINSLIVAGKARIALQKALIDDLERRKQPTFVARDVLQRLTDSLFQAEHRRRSLLKKSHGAFDPVR
jgi:hypothetical protein